MFAAGVTPNQIKAENNIIMLRVKLKRFYEKTPSPDLETNFVISSILVIADGFHI